MALALIIEKVVSQMKDVFGYLELAANQIYQLQNAAAHFVFCLDYRSHLILVLTELHILPIKRRKKFEIATVVFQFLRDYFVGPVALWRKR